MSENAARPIRIKLMNDYGAEIPLWDEEGHTDGQELGLSESLVGDLAAFAERWEAAVPAEVYDDRYDGDPVKSRLVRMRYGLKRLVNPAERQARIAEHMTMAELGEGLRSRLQTELGPDYRVTYHH